MLFCCQFPTRTHALPENTFEEEMENTPPFSEDMGGCSAQKELFFPYSFRATFRLQNFYRAFLFPLYFIPLQKRERKAKRSDFHCGSKKMPSFSLCMAREEQKMEVGIRNYAF